MDTKSYFTIAELYASDTAKKYNIDNTPDATIISHLQQLINFLNPLREAWGSAIKVTSGYRCEKLNKFVGGSKTSSHMIGYGVDLIPTNGRMDEFKKFIVDYMKNKMFDQCIVEKSGKTEWVHIGLYNLKGQQRRMIFNIIK